MKFQELLGPVVSAVVFFAFHHFNVVGKMTDQFEKTWQELVVRPSWLLKY